MIFSFLQSISFDQFYKALEKVDIFFVFFLGPMQTIIFLNFLKVALEPIFDFSWFEEPRLDRLESGSLLGRLRRTRVRIG